MVQSSEQIWQEMNSPILANAYDRTPDLKRRLEGYVPNGINRHRENRLKNIIKYFGFAKTRESETRGRTPDYTTTAKWTEKQETQKKGEY